GIGDHAGFQRDDRVRNLEGRGRQPRFARADLVAGDDQIVIDLVADEGADRSGIEETSCQVVAKFAALVGNIGETARGRKGSCGKQSERMTAIDHGRYPRQVVRKTMRMASW